MNYAVVGFGTAGYHAVKAIRTCDKEGEIDVYSNTSRAPYNPMLTTYYAFGKLEFDGLFPFGDLDQIRQVHEVEGIRRIRLGSLEPRIITDDFAKALASMPKFCPHFHLSLQSGCDETLKRMNRHYTTEEYAAGCDILRRYFDNPAITTDVIVGFPGETEEEFEATKAFLERIGFYEMHIFKYSRRAGTRADRMPEQVPEQIKNVRSEALLLLEKQMSKAYRESFLGKKKTVLLEEKTEIEGRAYMIGHTMEYVKAVVPYADDLKNKMTEGVLKEALNDEVLLLDESWKVV